MTTASEFPASVQIDENQVWAALESFFKGSAKEARQMRTGYFGSLDKFVASSMPFLDVTVDGKAYYAAIDEVNHAGLYLAGATVRAAYNFGFENPYRYIMIELADVGPIQSPQAKPTALQKRWEMPRRDS